MFLIPNASDAPLGSGPRARLGYCLNLHASETLDDVRDAIERYVLRVRDRVLGPRSIAEDSGGASFGVGMYLGAQVARELAGDGDALRALAQFLREERIDPFTYNAFPYGGFQEDGLKERVYLPSWRELERLAYTVDVATVAATLRAELGGDKQRSIVSISTHPGGYGTAAGDRGELREYADNLGRAVGEIARIEESHGYRIVLALEAEPDASARNGRALAEFLTYCQVMGARVLESDYGRTSSEAAALMRRHLGTCLDCCHSAVEFEDARDAYRVAVAAAPLGKIQFSSALTLARPGEHPDAVDALLALAEPRFLHQVTANASPPTREAFQNLPDLPALALEARAPDSPWLAADEWRCHFHVPVDLADVGSLGTTRDHADTILSAALADPDSWGTPELHVEIETYTWSVMPDAASMGRDDDAIVDGLVREYEHVLRVCDASGWRLAAEG